MATTSRRRPPTLNGELDSLTPAGGGAHVAAQIGSSARAVVAADNVHLVALYDRYGCGSSLVQRFIKAPAAHGSAGPLLDRHGTPAT